MTRNPFSDSFFFYDIKNFLRFGLYCVVVLAVGKYVERIIIFQEISERCRRLLK